MTRRRRLLSGLGVLGAFLVVVLFVSALRGTYDVAGPAKIGGAVELPSWTRPCWVLEPSTAADPFSLRCARVHGTVVWVEREDPDGDGDQHQLVLAGVRLVKVKYRRARQSEPVGGIGADIRVIGSVPGGGGLLPVVEYRAAD